MRLPEPIPLPAMIMQGPATLLRFRESSVLVQGGTVLRLRRGSEPRVSTTHGISVACYTTCLKPGRACTAACGSHV
jgi:hypothetical protein